MANPCENKLASVIHSQGWYLDRIFSEYSAQFASIFRQYQGRMTQQKKAALERALRDFNDDMQLNIDKQLERSASLANACNDKLTKQYLASLSLSPALLQKAVDVQRSDAAIAFARRALDKRKFDISKRVWNLTTQTEENIINAMQSGIFNGRSAKELASDLQKYLKEPNRRYRRVRNEEGKLVLSNPAKDYHPGRGVYRSSYKNALRLTRTETNIAYRTVDFERRKKLDFVVGHEVRLSGAHPEYDICDELAGKYPKHFLFTGWHPQCLCTSIPILVPEREYINHLNTGKPIDKRHTVKNVPKRTREYVKENSDKLGGNYFIRDNFKLKNGVYVPK